MSTTVADIAKKAGVTVGTVSNVLNGRSKGMRADARERARRILAIAHEMGYRPNTAARAMVTGRTRQVGVLVMNSPQDPDIDLFAYQTILGINDAMDEAGYLVCHVRLGDVRRALDGGSRIFRERALDGLIVLSDTSDDVREHITRLIPNTVWCDTNVWTPTHCVRRDEVAAGRAVAEQLLGLGYQQLFFHDEIQKPQRDRHYSFDDRWRGVQETARKHGIPAERFESWWEWDEALLEPYRRASESGGAVIAADYPRLQLGLRAASDLGLRPMHDLGLGCCEDQPDLARTWPHLPRVGFDRYDLGRRSARMMLALLQHEPNGSAINSVYIGATSGADSDSQ